MEDGSFDYENIPKAIHDNTKIVYHSAFQRISDTDQAFQLNRLVKLIAFVKEIKPDVICMVDNCYGEFVEDD